MRWLVVLATLAAAGGAAAEDCGTLATQLEMNACAGRNFDRADAELNRVYGEVTARLGGDAAGLGRLRAAERAWVAFRDTECDFAAVAVEQGSIHPMIWAGCREAMTLDRTEALRGYLACEEGDLACPVPAQ
jgi:uncharacterized protein YecT (DUF1311 family)